MNPIEPTTARYRSDCPVCLLELEPGDEVRLFDGEDAHDHCVTGK